MTNFFILLGILAIAVVMVLLRKKGEDVSLPYKAKAVLTKTEQRALEKILGIQKTMKADLSATEEILRLRQQIEDLKAQLSEAGKTSTIGTEDLAQGNDLIPIKFENLQRALEKILGIQKTILDAKTAFEMADEHNARQIASENFAKINLQKIVEAMWIHDEIEHLFSSESKANLAKSRQAFIDAKNDNYANALEEATELIVKGNCFIRDFQNEIKQNLTLHSR